MIKAYVWVKPNFGRSGTACSQVYVYENKYLFFLRSIFTNLILNFNLLKYVSEMSGHPLTTVSKIFLHKLYKIVSELFLESLKTHINHTFSRGFLPSFVLFVSYFGG
jgi:hypothetical protein